MKIKGKEGSLRWELLHLRYHVRAKVLLWGLLIMLMSNVLSTWVTPWFTHQLLPYVADDPESAGLFLRICFFLVPCVIYLVLASLLVLATFRPMYNRFLDLSAAARSVARGDFSVSVQEKGRLDELGQLCRDFNLMTAQLRQNEYLGKDFVSGVSHEIKTPLAIISGYADLLCDPRTSEAERREYTAIISRESRRLQLMTGNMLKISRLDNQQILASREQFPLDEQLRQVVLLLEEAWQEKQINIELELAPITCFGNQEMLSQVWLNLLDNAIKFSPAGSRITVTARQEADRCRVSVKDQGEGMDEATCSRIFDRFYQGESSHSGEGNGLGLAIVHRILELHQGTVTVKSAPGEGSEFTVTLPLK